MKKKNRNHEDAWKQFYQILKLKEPDLTESFNQQSRTWKNGAISARLDRFYIKKFYDDFNFQYFKHINFIKSNHNMVSIKIVLENNNSKVNKSINIWRLNDNILLNEDVSKKNFRIEKQGNY